MKEPFTTKTTFWISGLGTNEDQHDQGWSYSTALEDDYYFHVFWGFSPRGLKTSVLDLFKSNLYKNGKISIRYRKTQGIVKKMQCCIGHKTP